MVPERNQSNRPSSTLSLARQPIGYLRTATGRFETGIWFLAGCIIMAGALAFLIRAPGKLKSNAT
jgi:hypothetical protein